MSYSYLLDQLDRDPNTKNVAEALEKFILDEIKKNGDIIYAGLLLSFSGCSIMVENHLYSDNEDLVFISAGINNPATLITKAFERAKDPALAQVLAQRDLCLPITAGLRPDLVPQLSSKIPHFYATESHQSQHPDFSLQQKSLTFAP